MNKKRITAFLLSFLMVVMITISVPFSFMTISAEAVGEAVLIEGVEKGAALLVSIMVAMGLDVSNVNDNVDNYKMVCDVAWYYASQQLKDMCNQIAEDWDSTHASIIRVGSNLMAMTEDLMTQLYVSIGDEYIFGDWNDYTLSIDSDNYIGTGTAPELGSNIVNYLSSQEDVVLGSNAVILAGHLITGQLLTDGTIILSKDGVEIVYDQFQSLICNAVPEYRVWGAYAQFTTISAYGNTFSVNWTYRNSQGQIAYIYAAYTFNDSDFTGITEIPVSVYPGSLISIPNGMEIDSTGLLENPINLPYVDSETGVLSIPTTQTQALNTTIPIDGIEAVDVPVVVPAVLANTYDLIIENFGQGFELLTNNVESLFNALTNWFSYVSNIYKWVPSFWRGYILTALSISVFAIIFKIIRG